MTCHWYDIKWRTGQQTLMTFSPQTVRLHKFVLTVVVLYEMLWVSYVNSLIIQSKHFIFPLWERWGCQGTSVWDGGPGEQQPVCPHLSPASQLFPHFNPKVTEKLYLILLFKGIHYYLIFLACIFLHLLGLDCCTNKNLPENWSCWSKLELIQCVYIIFKTCWINISHRVWLELSWGLHDVKWQGQTVLDPRLAGSKGSRKGVAVLTPQDRGQVAQQGVDSWWT